MQSILLDCIKSNTFIPFPDLFFSEGTDGENNFVDIKDMVEKKYESLESLKKDQSYTTWKYSGQDNTKTLKLNLKLAKKDWYYRNNSVTYTLNSFGYRTKNFNQVDWSNSIVIFGCSMVQGVGVDDIHTLSHFLEKEMNMPVINMGVAGSSNEFHIHNVNVLLSEYPRPKAILYALTGLQRHSFYHWNYVNHRGSWNDTESQSKVNRSNSIIRNIMTTNIISNMCGPRTTYIEYCTEYYTYQFLQDVNKNQNRFHLDPGWSSDIKYEHRETSQSEFARDFSHPGKDYHKGLSKLLAEILKSRIT